MRADWVAKWCVRVCLRRVCVCVSDLWIEPPAPAPSNHFPPPSQAVSCVNLVNQHGSEGTLEAEFAKEAKR
jgi:hypothetical protein